MKILNLPVPLRINCECGCDFEFDTDDLSVITMYMDSYESKRIKIECPFCKKQHILKEIVNAHKQ